MAGNRLTNSAVDPDLAGNFDSSSAGNFIGDGTGATGISNGANQNQVGMSNATFDPLLAPLGSYGGHTQTMALLPGSQAIGTGEALVGVTTDQRGVLIANPLSVCIGAYQTSPASQVNGPDWSGYDFEPGSGVTAVGGTWVQPAESGPSKARASIWVGIDGAANGTVEQCGTSVKFVNGQPQYYAWYELFGDQKSSSQTPNPNPKGPDFSAQHIPNFPVNAGDTISAEVTFVSGRTFLFQMKDTPQNGGPVETFSLQQTMKYVVPKLSSAEWILENPNQGTQPLANFGQVTFTGAWATVGSTTQDISEFKNYHAINMVHSGVEEVSTSHPELDSNTLGFNEPSTGVCSSSFTVTFLASAIHSGNSSMSGNSAQQAVANTSAAVNVGSTPSASTGASIPANRRTALNAAFAASAFAGLDPWSWQDGRNSSNDFTELFSKDERDSSPAPAIKQ